MTRSSSTRPMPSRLAVRLGLPRMVRPLPGSCLSLAISSATFSRTSLVSPQSAAARVVDTTTLGRLFISSATTGSSSRAAAVGQ